MTEKLILELHAEVSQRPGSVSVLCAPKDMAEVIAMFKLAGFEKALLYPSVMDAIETEATDD